MCIGQSLVTLYFLTSVYSKFRVTGKLGVLVLFVYFN